MESLKQWVPSDVCLSCDGCCRFKEADSPWRPKLSAEDKTKGLAEKIFSPEKVDAGGALVTVPCHGMHVCTFFKVDDNSCKIYRNRPFECELYPFILSRHDGRPAVYVHLNCPHVQQNRPGSRFDTHVEYLKGYFHDDSVLNFLKRNSSLISDYTQFQNELEYLFTLAIL